jgi:hypothetical protein
MRDPQGVGSGCGAGLGVGANLPMTLPLGNIDLAGAMARHFGIGRHLNSTIDDFLCALCAQSAVFL